MMATPEDETHNLQVFWMDSLNHHHSSDGPLTERPSIDCMESEAHLAIVEGVDGSRGRGMAGAGVGLFSAHLLGFHERLYNLFDCLCAIVMHWLWRKQWRWGGRGGHRQTMFTLDVNQDT